MSFVAKRVAQLVVVLLAVTFLSSLFLNLLPGSTADAVCKGECTAEQRAQVEEQLGLNDPVIVRYVHWLGRVLPPDVDLGSSAMNGESVATALGQRLPVTVELVIYSQLLALAVSVPLGVVCARRANGLVDRTSTVLGFIFLAVPPFVLALLLVSLFAVRLRWFPTIGYTPFLDNPLVNLRDLFLPALTLAVGEVAVLSRLLRTDLMATLQEDYITMAKAKGLPSRHIMWRHAFRPSIFSLVTVAGLRLGALIGGALIIEFVFQINGLGLFAISAISNRDFIPLQAVVSLIAVGYVVINFAVDLFYAVLDPRIRHARAIA